MAYYNRKQQILASLDKFEELYGNKYNLEVIIVDDKSDENNILDDYIHTYSFQIKYIKLMEKTWINPVVAYNVGFENISSDTDYVIIQNPEIYHCANIIEHFIDTLHDNEYYTYPVFSSPNFKENERLYKITDNYFENFINQIDYTKYRFDYQYYINKYDDIKHLNELQAYSHFENIGLKENRSCNIENCFYREDIIYKWKGWYNHVTLNNRNLHFLSVVKYNTLQIVGGFCNEMKDGLWYDDNDFLYRMSQVVNVKTIDSNKYLGIHQFHISALEDHHSNSYLVFNNIEKTIITNNKIKISIVMAYFNDRKEQTVNTLNGFEKMYAGKYRFEVIIVDDNSDAENKLDKVIKYYSFPINLIVISKEEKGDRVNPCIAYNRGFKEAKGEIIIIQNPESYHVGDILKHTIDNLTEQDYFSYSCYASNSYNITEELLESNNIYNLINNKDFKNRNCFDVKSEGELLEWYNHPTYKTEYHYCCSIYKSRLSLIGGFDERFKDGYCFDDDELLHSIKYKLKQIVSVINPQYYFVIHQFHKRNPSYNINIMNDTNVIKKKWMHNKSLYELIQFEYKILQYNHDQNEIKFNEISNFLLKRKIYKKHTLELYSEILCNELDKYLIEHKLCDKICTRKNIIYVPQKINYYSNIPKIAFTYWDMSNLTFMHYLTLYTFKKHHPDWTIVLYYPTKRVTNKSWHSNENKLNVSTLNYISELSKLNIEIIEINFEYEFPNIPYYLSEVIKSDLFRLYACNTSGGVWIDMDTFWINSLENKCSLNKFDYFDDIKKIYMNYNNS